MHDDLAVGQWHDVWHRVCIIVIVVLLACREAHDYRILSHVDRVSHSVAMFLVPQADGIARTGNVHSHILLDAQELLAHHVHLLILQTGCCVVDAAIGGYRVVAEVGQVECLSHRARLEQGAVARGIDFGHLVFDGEERYFVFARQRVGTYHDAMYVAIHVCHVALHTCLGVCSTVTERLVALLDIVVKLVAHNPRAVVALQLEHHRDTLTQVVLRQRLSQRLVALDMSANDATLQAYLGLVPENAVVDALLPCDVRRIVGIQIVAVVLELVAFLPDLDGVFTLRHAQ